MGGDEKIDMSKNNQDLIAFLTKLMRNRKRLPSHLAKDISISHATISRWLSGKDIPSIRSCWKLAKYSGKPVNEILSIAGYVPYVKIEAAPILPDFRDYARQKYPSELDEDIVTMIEDLIERRKNRGHNGIKPYMRI